MLLMEPHDEILEGCLEKLYAAANKFREGSHRALIRIDHDDRQSLLALFAG
jgi:hypothetical protein